MRWRTEMMGWKALMYVVAAGVSGDFTVGDEVGDAVSPNL
jgi:hypothetical protein